MADPSKIAEYLRARDALREATDRGRSQPSSRDARAAHEAAQRRFHAISQQISFAGEARIRQIIPDELFDDGLGPEYDIPSRRPAGSEAAYRSGATARPLPQAGTRGRRPYGTLPGRAEVVYDLPERPPPIRQRVAGAQLGPRPPSAEALHLQDLIDEIEWRSRDLRALPPRPDRAAWLAREGERLTALKQRLAGLFGEEGFISGVAPSARSTAARGLATTAGVVAAPFIDYALDPESRTPVQFARSQEEAITGMVPGTVSPSELPPPAVLPPDRRRAVEATQGMVGVAPDTQTPNVTAQEVRTYVLNQYAKGEPLSGWARRIVRVLPNGELAVNPVNPRAAETRSNVAKTWDVLD